MSDTNPYAHRLSELVATARATAGRVEHRWDQQALEWPLTAASVVVEVGGYVGRWALQMAQRYAPRLYVFEPQLWAVDVCRALLADYNATVLPYGLGERDATLPMGEWETDGCSFVKDTRAQGVGVLREIGQAFADLGIARIDAMLMNIEGYEYTLLPHMLDKHIYPQRLMVQFHPVTIPDMQLPAIVKRLKRAGYKEAWTYGPKLMAWERKA